MQNFRIVPASEKSRQSLVVFAGLLPFLPISALFVQAVPRPVVIAPTLVATLLLLYLTRAMNRVSCTLSLASLTIRADLFGRRIERSALLAAEVRIVSLRDEPQFQPKWRTFGTAWPGYLSGWYRLRSKQKAFMVVTDQDKVVYLPTTQGYALLLSLEQPDAFLKALREGTR